jgi:hypothetical protein
MHLEFGTIFARKAAGCREKGYEATVEESVCAYGPECEAPGLWDAARHLSQQCANI